MDVSELETALDRIDESVREARAAVALLREGDPAVMAELDELVDAMAGDVAELKGRTARGSTGL